MSFITTRAVKGSPLTWDEVDANFNNLNTDKIESGYTVASLTINNITVTGGTITGITDIAIADGGTGASTASGARTNLGLGSIATQASSNVAITGGNIDGTALGATTASTGKFTNLEYSGTFTGGTGIVNIGSNQIYKDASGNVGFGMVPGGTATVQISAGTASKAPLELTTGTLMTTPDAGAFEYLTNVGYFTPTTNNRAVIVTEHFVARTGTKTMTSNTSLQSLFGGGTGGLTNGALTVDANTSYYFECLLSVSSMSATSGNLGFSIVGAGTAAFTSAAFIAVGYDQTTLTTPAATSAGGVYVATSALATNVVTATTGTSAAVLLKGIFRIAAGGTIIPSIQLTTAAAAVIDANCWFKCYPVGTNTAISVGNWS